MQERWTRSIGARSHGLVRIAGRSPRRFSEANPAVLAGAPRPQLVKSDGDSDLLADIGSRCHNAKRERMLEEVVF